MTYTKGLTLAAVGALTLAAAPAARAITLSDLITSGTPVVSGDKIFSNWGYSSATLPADQVAVDFVPSTSVQFSAGWNTAYAPGIMDSVIKYSVSTTPASGMAISGVNLSFAGLIAESGGVAFVGESVTPDNGPTSNLSVVYDGAGPLADRQSDSVSIAPTNTLHIIKNITVTPVRNNPASFASVTFVDNTFVQVPTGGGPPVIPEPMSLALLPLALLGLGLRKRLAR